MSNLTSSPDNFLLYSSDEGDIRLDVLVNNDTVWLTQKAMQELFGRAKSTISEHISNIFAEGELVENQVVRKFRTTADDGKDYDTTFYNLDVIISVGYRVKSLRGTQFRIWATKTLREFIVKGFALDDERLKQGKKIFGKDYFDELLERVRSIRASERRIYQKITDIFQECSIDYHSDSEIRKTFFATVQNKFHFAITNNTAAEIIHSKTDSKKKNMGLATWKNAPEGRILKSDTTVAKNYLEEKEIKQLERTVSGYFDYIENLIERRNTFTMEQLAESVNKFLSFNEFNVLGNAGSISKKQAKKKAQAEYDEFNKTQQITSDFDKEIKRLESAEKKNSQPKNPSTKPT